MAYGLSNGHVTDNCLGISAGLIGGGLLYSKNVVFGYRAKLTDHTIPNVVLAINRSFYPTVLTIALMLQCCLRLSSVVCL